MTGVINGVFSGESPVMYSKHVLLGSTVGEVHCETSIEGSSCHALYSSIRGAHTLQFCK